MKFVKQPLFESGAGLSRIWGFIQDDNRTFAIIGSRDKDTNEDRSNELLANIREYMEKHLNVGYIKMLGTYTHKDGHTVTEKSFLISNINFQDAVKIMNAINQESIIWKDNSFFGFINEFGEKDGELSIDKDNMSFSAKSIEDFSSRINSKHNKGQKFVFKEEFLIPDKAQSSIRNLGGNNFHRKEHLFTINF